MHIIRTVNQLRKTIIALRTNNKTKISLVPTMGALHKGHFSLINIARKLSDKVIVSIFVNPTQFAPHEDYNSYPRQESLDVKKLREQKVDIAYIPNLDEIYHSNFDTKISLGRTSQELEGAIRPHFFDGVALIVTKLLMQAQPNIAIFGEKDYQQLYLIQRLVSDLNIPIPIIGAPTIREDDGLATSSRNIYLSPEERIIASNLPKILYEVRDKIISGQKIITATEWGKKKLLKTGFDNVDYLEVRDESNFLRATKMIAGLRLLAAVNIGQTRLIDNIPISQTLYH